MDKGTCAGTVPPLRPAQPPPSPLGGRPPPPPPSSLPVAGWRHGVGRRQEQGAHGGRQARGERPCYRSAGQRYAAVSSLHPPSLERGTVRPVPRAPSLWPQPYNALPIVAQHTLYIRTCRLTTIARVHASIHIQLHPYGHMNMHMHIHIQRGGGPQAAASLGLLQPLEALSLDADAFRKVTAAAVTYCDAQGADSFADLVERASRLIAWPQAMPFYRLEIGVVQGGTY